MEKIEPFDSIIGNEIMIYCDKSSLGVLSPYHYLNIETMNIISFYPGENEPLLEMDVAEYMID